MKLSYRNQHNAEATAAFWKEPLDKLDWYKIEALSGDDTEILIYGIIGWPFNDISDLVRSLAEIKTSTITVRINSKGGDAFDAIALFNVFQAHKSKIITRIEALAASAGSIIALAGKEVQAYKNSMMMIHNTIVLAGGNQYELRDIADVLEKFDENMADIYAGNSNVGKKEIREMMKAITYMNAKEMKEKGFIDTILDGKTAKAQFDLSMFAHVPDDFMADNRHEPTEREIEKALKGMGVSQSRSKFIIAASKKAEGKEIEDIVVQCEKVIAIIEK